MVADIEIISKELIKPSSPTPHDCKHHQLPFLDQFQVLRYVPLIFLYETQSLSSINDHSKRLQHLKHSLSETLTKFFHLAGRMKGNVYIDCNDSGALLVEAQVHASLSQAIQNATIDELNQYLPLEPYDLSKNVTITDPTLDDFPLLAVQISFFECGGTTIGVCISHKVADFTALVMFMDYWAALSRGEKIDPLKQPDCDRASQLFPGVDPESPFPNFSKQEGKEKLITKRFLFDKEKLATLKELASSDEFSGLQVKDPTRVEVVSAFIWKQLIDISRAKDDNKSMFVAFQAVNLRAKMNSSFPSENSIGFNNVFGNIAVPTKAISISTARGFGNHYQELVWMLRAAIRSVDGDLIKIVQSGVPYLNAFNNACRLLRDPQVVHICSFNSWCRFPYYEVDYGWGKPLSVCTVALPHKNTIIFMSTRCGDGIVAWITMLEDEMTMLPDELASLVSTTYY